MKIDQSYDYYHLTTGLMFERAEEYELLRDDAERERGRRLKAFLEPLGGTECRGSLIGVREIQTRGQEIPEGFRETSYGWLVPATKTPLGKAYQKTMHTLFEGVVDPDIESVIDVASNLEIGRGSKGHLLSFKTCEAHLGLLADGTFYLAVPRRAEWVPPDYVRRMTYDEIDELELPA